MMKKNARTRAIFVCFLARKRALRSIRPMWIVGIADQNYYFDKFTFLSQLRDSFTTQQRGWGMKPPNLNGVSDWISAGQFKQILNIGPCYMPSFVAMEDKNKEDIYAYLSTLEGSYNNTNSRKRRGCGCRMGMR